MVAGFEDNIHSGDACEKADIETHDRTELIALAVELPRADGCARKLCASVN